MNIEEPLRTVAAALAESGLQAPGAAPMRAGRWVVLFGGRQRPLLMPAGDYELQKRWLSFFVDGRLRSLYAMTVLKLNSLVPRAGLLPELRLPLARRAAVQIGTPGPYRKASALLVSQTGEALALAKIALLESADPMVAKEARWLRRVAGIEKLADQVPRLLAEGSLAGGRRYLVTSLAPTTRASTEFTPAHARFLGALGRSDLQSMRFRDSPCCEYLERTLAAIEPSVTRGEAGQLRGALLDCRLSLAHWVGPFVVSQGDFARWNVRKQRESLFVFDWEYARAGANPLSDVFHYHLVERAASGRHVGARLMREVMRRARDIARELYPEWSWRDCEISALALAYLLEVLLLYCRASGGLDRSDDVLRSYWLLLERRAAWLAA